MDSFSIPDRLEPVAPTENTRHHRSPSSDQRRRRSSDSLPPETNDEDIEDKNEDGDSPQEGAADTHQEGEDPHNVDELA